MSFVIVCLNFEDWYPNVEKDMICGKILANDIVLGEMKDGEKKDTAFW